MSGWIGGLPLCRGRQVLTFSPMRTVAGKFHISTAVKFATPAITRSCNSSPSLCIAEPPLDIKPMRPLPTNGRRNGGVTKNNRSSSEQQQSKRVRKRSGGDTKRSDGGQTPSGQARRLRHPRISEQRRGKEPKQKPPLRPPNGRRTKQASPAPLKLLT